VNDLIKCLLIIENEYVALLSFYYILFVEYYLTSRGRLADCVHIYMNG
jgi:hypothetical protein